MSGVAIPSEFMAIFFMYQRHMREGSKAIGSAKMMAMFVVAIAVSLSSLVSLSFAEDVQPQKTLPSSEFSRFQEGVRKFTLSNGIRVIYFHRAYAPVFNGQTWVKVGGVNEIPGSTGIAHLLEHMAFKGTETIGTKDYAHEKELLAQIEGLIQRKQSGEQGLDPEIARLQQGAEALIVDNEFSRLYLAQGGADLNAATAKDFTYYTVSLPNVAFELWCWMESERLLKPVYRQFYKELEVVQEERRMRTDDSPEGRLYEALLSAAFWNHPNRLPVIGWPGDLKRLTATELGQFRNSYYRADNIVIALVGDLDARVVESLTEKYFGRMPRPTTPLLTPTAIEPEQNGARYAEVEFDAEPMFLWGFHKPTYPSFDDAAFSVVHSILGDGRSSLFQKELVQEKRVAVGVETSEAPGELYPNLFYLLGVPKHGVPVEQLKGDIEAILNRLKDKPVAQELLDAAKRRVRVGMLQALSSDHEIAAAFGKAELLWGDWSAPLKTYDQILSTTSADVQRLAKKYFRNENGTLVVLRRPANSLPAKGGK